MAFSSSSSSSCNPACNTISMPAYPPPSQGLQINANRPFCFIISNSHDFITNQLEPARQQYRQQRAATHRIDWSLVRYTGNNNVEGQRIDQKFEKQLQTLIYRYMAQTRHPDPIKFIIDLTKTV